MLGGFDGSARRSHEFPSLQSRIVALPMSVPVAELPIFRPFFAHFSPIFRPSFAHFSPIFRPFCTILRPFSPSLAPGSRTARKNGERTAENGAETAEKEWLGQKDVGR